MESAPRLVNGDIVDASVLSSDDVFHATISQQEKATPPEFPASEFAEFPVCVKISDSLGRYLAASKDIKKGEIVLRDTPILVSPNSSDNGHTCFGCCVKIQDPVTCPDCRLPLCSYNCDQLSVHKENECEVFRKNGLTADLPAPFSFVNIEELIKVLRGVLLTLGRTEEESKNWRLMQRLEGHIEYRKSIPKVLFMCTLSKKFILQMCKLDQFDEATIDFILGVIDVNAFRHTVHPNNPLRRPTRPKDVERNATFLFPFASLAAHGCRRNVRWETLQNGKLEMWAAEDIQEGQLLTHPYVDLMLGTPDRRRQLRNQFFFDCCCSRCSDPLELGTYLSVLKCPECKNGHLVAEHPLDYNTCWKCNKCDCRKSSDFERDLVFQIQSEKKTVLEAFAGGSNLAVIGGLGRILGKYQGKRVHPNHFALIDVEYNLVKRMANISKPSPGILHEMKRLIHKFLDIAEVFYPGIK